MLQHAWRHHCNIRPATASYDLRRIRTASMLAPYHPWLHYYTIRRTTPLCTTPYSCTPFDTVRPASVLAQLHLRRHHYTIWPITASLTTIIHNFLCVRTASMLAPMQTRQHYTTKSTTTSPNTTAHYLLRVLQHACCRYCIHYDTTTFLVSCLHPLQLHSITYFLDEFHPNWRHRAHTGVIGILYARPLHPVLQLFIT